MLKLCQDYKKVANMIFPKGFWNNKVNKIDFIFILIFVILLFIPMSHISNAEKSEKENRMLAKKPELIVNGQVNEKYGSEFNDYFQDRFYGRKQIIRLYSHIQKTLFFNRHKKVFIGKDGWLFLKEDHSLDNFQNKTLFFDEDLEHIAKYLSDINDWATKNGKDFYYVIVPDKNKIYGENITTLKKLRPDSESRANQLVNYLHQNTKIKVIYLYDVLTLNKPNGLLYYKTDTHWNDFGAFLGYQEIINKIKEHHRNIRPISYNETEYKSLERGDLTKMLGDNDLIDLTKYKSPIIKDFSKCEYNSVDKNLADGFLCHNKNKKRKVFFLMDSFGTALIRYLNNTFNTVKYEWRYGNMINEDLQYIKNNSDIIIFEQAERYLPLLLNHKFPKE